MPSDLELMLDEFMHGFGDSTNVIRLSLYDLAAATGNFEWIPDNYRGKNISEYYKKNKTQFDARSFKTRIERVIERYDILNEITTEQTREKEIHSSNFNTVKKFTEQIGEAVASFKEFLTKEAVENNYLKLFDPHLDALRSATHAINEIFVIRNFYNQYLDGTEARKRWAAKHPGWHS